MVFKEFRLSGFRVHRALGVQGLAYRLHRLSGFRVSQGLQGLSGLWAVGFMELTGFLCGVCRVWILLSTLNPKHLNPLGFRV